MGGFILPREIVATADSKGAFFGTFFRSAGRKESTKKSGLAVRDARASLKIPHSRRGRRAVHQIMGSKLVTVAIYLTKSF